MYPIEIIFSDPYTIKYHLYAFRNHSLENRWKLYHSSPKSESRRLHPLHIGLYDHLPLKGQSCQNKSELIKRGTITLALYTLFYKNGQLLKSAFFR